MASELKQQLSQAVKDAMRARDKVRLGTLRMAQSELKRIEVDERIELDDARVIAILDKMIKQRRDAQKQYEEAERDDLASVEAAEITVLQEFMPKALSVEEIEQLITDAVAQTGASSMKEMGAVMAILKPQLQGRADLGAVSKLIKSKLN